MGTTTAATYATALALLLTACSGTAGQTKAPDSPVPGPASTAQQERPTDGGQQGATEAVAAIRTAVGAVPGGKVFDIEDENRGGEQIWEIKLVAEGKQYELDVAQDGSKVLNREEKTSPSDDAAKLDDATIDASKAAELGVGRATGRLIDMEIDTLPGGATPVWQMTFAGSDGKRSELNLDARSGEPR